MPMVSFAKRKPGNCIVCFESKQTSLPFKHIGTTAKNLLEVVHGDVCRPTEVTYIGG